MSHARRNTVSNIFGVTVVGLVAGNCCSVTDLDHLLAVCFDRRFSVCLTDYVLSVNSVTQNVSGRLLKNET